jgi:hypothetical protein
MVLIAASGCAGRREHEESTHVLHVPTKGEPVKEKPVGASEVEPILFAPFQIKADLFAEWSEDAGIPHLERHLVQEGMGRKNGTWWISAGIGRCRVPVVLLKAVAHECRHLG